MAYSRRRKKLQKKLTRPTLRLSDMGLDQVHCLDDCALIDYAITAAAALAAADDDLGEEYIEVVCPHGSRPGDVLDVRLPHGGTVRASVPAGVGPGESFDVYPEGSGRRRRR